MNAVAIPGGRTLSASALAFFAVSLILAVAAALLAGLAPLRFSIVTVFLFAGPHNFLEARYFLARLPGRWGKLRGYFSLAFAGIFLLAAGFLAFLWASEHSLIEAESQSPVCALLYTALVLWVAALAHLRSRTNPKRDWGLLWPAAFLVVALAWLAPAYWGLALVYLHPLLALFLLDRELKRSRPAWRSAYHAYLACLPLLLVFLWRRLADVPPLPEEDDLSRRIADHAGACILPHLSSHLLVATHTFLEMLHYAVWIVAIPWVALQSAPWRLEGVPMVWRGQSWRRGLMGFLAAGAVVMLVLWAGFLVDYSTTRKIYFSAAVIHVLAEFPFLLRTL